MSIEFLEKVEYKGKTIRGKIHNHEVYLLAKDITDLFGYKSGKNAINKKINRENILKFPVDGVNGNQYNLISIAGINELLKSEIKLVDKNQKKEITEIIEGVIDFLQKKNEFLLAERSFIWVENEKKRKNLEEKEKPFWKKLLGI